MQYVIYLKILSVEMYKLKPYFTAFLLYSWDFNVSVFGKLNVLSNKKYFHLYFVQKITIKAFDCTKHAQPFHSNVHQKCKWCKSFHIQLTLHVKYYKNKCMQIVINIAIV